MIDSGESMPHLPLREHKQFYSFGLPATRDLWDLLQPSKMIASVVKELCRKHRSSNNVEVITVK